MKFAHLADVHIGSWKEPKMSELGILAFEKSITKCIELNVDFLLIAGDLFNTALPQINFLKRVVSSLKKLKNNKIPTYIIAGSHDFSPSGKTMLDVLEEADLLVNVVKGEVIENKLRLNFTIDNKTGAKITGILGKKGMLDHKYYEALDRTNLEQEQGYKIFMFHTALSEFKPKDLDNMPSHPLSLLPKNFNYYAGGHVHYIFQKEEPDYGLITYPGALFPNNFSELEKYSNGGMYIVEENNIEWLPIVTQEHEKLIIDVKHTNPLEIENQIIDKLNNLDLTDKILTIRIKGTLESGKISDIDFNRIYEKCYSKGAFFIMKNTSKLSSNKMEDVKVEMKNNDEIEKNTIQEQIGQVDVKLENEKDFTEKLMVLLNVEKQEGERKIDYEKKIIDNFSKLSSF